MNILYIDIEGGFGGSSRSLYYLIKNLDRTKYVPTVILGQHGPAEKRYQSIQIKTYVFSPIPRSTAMLRNNWRAIVRFTMQLIYLPKFLSLLRCLIKKSNIQIIHLNHESLFFIGLCCKLIFNVKIVCHVRTMLPINIWAKVQIFIVKQIASYLIFITENEQALWGH